MEEYNLYSSEEDEENKNASAVSGEDDVVIPAAASMPEKKDVNAVSININPLTPKRRIAENAAVISSSLARISQ